MRSVQLIAALGLFVAGSVASIQQAMSLASCSACTNAYMDCINSDYSDSNFQICTSLYNGCAQGCSFTSTAAKSLASCTTCATDYQDCVISNPNNWYSCLNTYNSCIPGCTFGAKSVSLSSCYSCSTTYSQCVTNNPNDW